MRLLDSCAAPLLIDVQDDLLELADVLRGLPGLRQLYESIRAGVRCRESGGMSGGMSGVSEAMDEADLIDLGAAPDVILSAVQCRLKRIAAGLHSSAPQIEDSPLHRG